MARIFKRTFRDKKTGNQKKTAKWYVEFKDHHDLVRPLPSTTDKAGTEQIGRFIEKLVACRIAGAELPRDLATWLESLPQSFVNRLVKLDLLDSRRLAAGQPLSDHVAAYRAWLEGKRRNPKHVALTIRRVERVIETASAAYWSSLTPEAVENALRRIQKERGLSNNTRNKYLTAATSFCNFMVKEGRAATSPAAGIEAIEVEDSEYRRALEPEEAQRLIAAAAAGPDQSGLDRKSNHRWYMTGPERALLYSVGLQTGFRAGALRRLKVSDFDLEGESPSVRLKGLRATKNKKDMVQVLQPQTAAALRQLFTKKLPDSPAFGMPSETKLAAVLRSDLEAARAAWIEEGETPEERAKRAQSGFLAAEDEDGRRVDFHALRTTTGTMLALLDVPRAVTQRIMGHSNYATTDKYYTRVNQDERRSVIDKLPDLSPQTDVIVATGTDPADCLADWNTDRKACGRMRTHEDERPEKDGLKRSDASTVSPEITHRNDDKSGENKVFEEWPRWDSNPYRPCGRADFKSAASANSATGPARRELDGIPSVLSSSQSTS